MGELIRIQSAAMTDAEAARKMTEMCEALAQMREALTSMAGILAATGETMAQLRRQMALLEKVTPAQATTINADVRARAAALCEMYGAKGCETRVAAAIRRALRLRYGARCARDIARVDYATARAEIGLWEDYGEIEKARKAMKKRE